MNRNYNRLSCTACKSANLVCQPPSGDPPGFTCQGCAINATKCSLSTSSSSVAGPSISQSPSEIAALTRSLEKVAAVAQQLVTSTQQISQSMNQLVKNTADVAQSTNELVRTQKIISQSSLRVTASNHKVAESTQSLAEAYTHVLALQEAQLMASDVATTAMEQLSHQAARFNISLSQPTHPQTRRPPQFQDIIEEETSKSSWTSSDEEPNTEEESEVENSLVMSPEL